MDDLPESRIVANTSDAPNTDDHGTVRRPDKDRRVFDADRFRDDRRREALAMIALWERSLARRRNPDAADELAYWKRQLAEIDGE